MIGQPSLTETECTKVRNFLIDTLNANHVNGLSNISAEEIGLELGAIILENSRSDISPSVIVEFW